MTLVRLDNVSKSFAGAPVLDGVNLQIESGERIGLVGRNGSGKSTIFALIANDIQPDEGLIERARRGRIARLRQLPDVDPGTPLIEIALRPFDALRKRETELRELEQRIASGEREHLDAYGEMQERFAMDGGYEYRARAARVLTGLGFPETEFDLAFDALSGGQRTRLMLALALLEDADLLLLDEPENHLDISAREWLENFLTSWDRAFVIVSHDRAMLNATVNRVLELERGKITAYSGNYDAYVDAKGLAVERQDKAHRKQQEWIRKEEAWIDRFRYKNTKAKQVQSRIKRLDKVDRIEAPDTDAKDVNLRFGEVARSGEIVLKAENLSMSYGALRLYRNVSFEIQRGDCVGIIGPNGCGKTTLLRQLNGENPDAEGTLQWGHKVSVGYYDQQHAGLNPAADVLTDAQSAAPAMKQADLRTYLGRFLFTGDDVFKPVQGLSGGERGRLALAKLVLRDHNVLMMDEPTNHLDIPSREVLESALQQYAGTLIIVTHDRRLIDRLATKLIVFEGETAALHLGNYSEYRDRAATDGSGHARPAFEAGHEQQLTIRRQQRTRADRKQAERERRRHERTVADLEAKISDLETLVEEYGEKFGKIDPADYEALQDAEAEYEGLRRDLKEMYEAWEEAVSALSALD